MSEAPTDRAARDERWIEVPAPEGGTWMVAIGAADAVVIAPPAVPLPPVDDPEGLGRWRVGRWPLDEHGWLARKADRLFTVHVITTANVLARLAQLHHPWVREVMRLQLAQHEAFATPQAGGLTDEERLRHAAHALHILRQELRVAFPDEDWYERTADDVPAVPETAIDLLAAIDGRPRSATAARSDGPWVFYRRGDVWTIGPPGRRIQLRHDKGLTHIARLLEAPYVEFHALDLIAGLQTPGPSPELAVGAGIEPGAHGENQSGPMLDADAKADYRRRVEALRDAIDQAASLKDPDRACRARQELAFLARELVGAIGTSNHRHDCETKRARADVIRAIHTALKRVSQHDEALGHQLTSMIRTGTFSVYQPAPGHEWTWSLKDRPD